MKITIIAAGKLKERYLRDGVDEFIKRLRPMAAVNITEINEEKMPDAPSAATKEKTLRTEGERLLRLVSAGSYLIVLDVSGKLMSSEELAAKIESLNVNGESHLSFVIGGPYGIADELRRAARLRLSLSPMTLTHQLARLILVEQIYRALKINLGEPYHL